jgi:hypothetical protein
MRYIMWMVLQWNYDVFSSQLCRTWVHRADPEDQRCIALQIPFFLFRLCQRAVTFCVQSQSHIETDGQSVCLSWCRAHLNGVLLKSLPSVCGSVGVSLIFARKRLGKNITTATNAHATIELLDAWFSVRSVSYEGKWAINFYEFRDSPVWRRGRIPPLWPCESQEATKREVSNLRQ